MKKDVKDSRAKDKRSVMKSYGNRFIINVLYFEGAKLRKKDAIGHRIGGLILKTIQRSTN